jgi:hypothetical protein
MAWEEEAVEEEEYGEEMAGSESEAEDVVVGQMPTVMVPKHIKKRSLKNKALSVTLDKKALRCRFLPRQLTIPILFLLRARSLWRFSPFAYCNRYAMDLCLAGIL